MHKKTENLLYSAGGLVAAAKRRGLGEALYFLAGAVALRAYGYRAGWVGIEALDHRCHLVDQACGYDDQVSGPCLSQDVAHRLIGIGDADDGVDRCAAGENSVSQQAGHGATPLKRCTKSLPTSTASAGSPLSANR